MRKKIAVLGIGNMGRTLTIGLARSTSLFDFTLFTPSQNKAQELASEINAFHLTELKNLEHQELILIACKPQQFDDLANSLKGHLSGGEIILSVMAGVSTSTIERKLGNKKIVRIMPNTPNRIGLGVNLFYFTKSIALPERTQILQAFKLFSYCQALEIEDQIDLFTVFTGSGPGLIFEFARIFEDGMMKRGLSKEIARELTTQTFLGSTTLMAQEKKDPLELRSQVTSKGGVTFAALKVMQDHNLENIMDTAFNQAYQRCIELGQSINN